MIKVDPRSTRKTAHIIVAENVPYPYGKKTGSKTKCGQMLWPENLRDRQDGEPICVRCSKLSATTKRPCPYCDGTGLIETGGE